jgi:hypothetical protein
MELAARRLTAHAEPCAVLPQGAELAREALAGLEAVRVGRDVDQRAPVLPAGPTRTERFLDYFFGPGVEEKWIAELIEFDGQVGAEDRVLVENVQRGVSTGLIERGRLLEESEQLIVDFQRRVEAALAVTRT